MVTVPAHPMTADDAFRLISTSLADNWQICALVGWVIMYNDHPRSYPSAFRYYRAGGEVSTQTPSTRQPSKHDTETEDNDE
jgi:hypothetical protein